MEYHLLALPQTVTFFPQGLNLKALLPQSISTKGGGYKPFLSIIERLTDTAPEKHWCLLGNKIEACPLEKRSVDWELYSLKKWAAGSQVTSSIISCVILGRLTWLIPRFILFFLATPLSLWDLSSPPRD